ncbi:MAG: DUF3109 family protein [Gemmataceae bacterium]|nr:DUF3109 family protein [Gemmataceae bacterium]
MGVSLPVVNVAEAKFECIFGRGCDGICCHNGRPPVDTHEVERIEAHLPKFLPHLRPEAREVVEEHGFLSRRFKLGLPMLRVVDKYCVFFNQGCVLHKVGAMDGDKFLYKPGSCAIFPLMRNGEGNWYVRQHGYENEEWDLFCLNPNHSAMPAAESLKDEIALAIKYDEAAEEEETPTRESA